MRLKFIKLAIRSPDFIVATSQPLIFHTICVRVLSPSSSLTKLHTILVEKCDPRMVTLILLSLAAFHTFIIISCTAFYTRRLRDRLTNRCDSLFLALDTIQELPSLYLFYSMYVIYIYCSFGNTLIKTVLNFFLLSVVNNCLIYPYVWCLMFKLFDDKT